MSKELDKVNEIQRAKAIYKADGTTVIESSWFNLLVAYAKEAIQRLEAIDNANPSEALEEIKTLRGFNQVELNNDENVNKSLDIIEQALLKAQESKKYLTWEDLEFEEEEQWLKVKLGDNVYRVDWYIDGLGANVVYIYKYITNDYLAYSACIKDNSQQFFNDLHLERVEE